MKKILGMIASPRKLGNCEIIVKEISRQVKIPHELTLLRLPDFNIQPCRGCYHCLFKEKQCIQKDDFNLVLNAMIEADALILAAPTYFLGPNGSLKLFLDRGLAFYAHAEKLWGKPSVGVGIAGIPGKEGYTLLGIQSFLKIMMSDIKKITMMYGALPGEIFFNEQNKALAAELGKALFDAPPSRDAHTCPLCGGDTFRFMGNNKVKCMLCSNSGTIAADTGSPVFSITRSEHELFLSQEEAMKHFEWLCKMKGRFVAEKDRLKQISISYLSGGTWIKP